MGRDMFWDDQKKRSKEKFDADRARFIEEANASDDGGWTRHTPNHWSRSVNGERLEYWPSRKKFLWRGHMQRGNVMRIVNRQIREG